MRGSRETQILRSKNITAGRKGGILTYAEAEKDSRANPSAPHRLQARRLARCMATGVAGGGRGRSAAVVASLLVGALSATGPERSETSRTPRSDTGPAVVPRSVAETLGFDGGGVSPASPRKENALSSLRFSGACCRPGGRRSRNVARRVARRSSCRAVSPRQCTRN